MKCDLSKDKLIAYFYEELDSEARLETEAHIAQCSACQKELQQFKKTSVLLQAWPDEQPELNLKIVSEKHSASHGPLKELSRLGWRRLGLSFAVAAVGILVVLSALNFRASYSDGNFSVQFSLLTPSESDRPLSQDSLVQPVTRSEFNAWKKDAYQLIDEMIQDAEARQNRQLNTKLAKLAREIDTQRRQDLRFVGRGLEAFQASNETQFQRTNEVLQQLIQVATQQDSGPDSIERH